MKQLEHTDRLALDYLSHEMARHHPELPQNEIANAMLLAVMELGGVTDREAIRHATLTLLGSGGIPAAAAIAGTHGVRGLPQTQGAF